MRSVSYSEDDCMFIRSQCFVGDALGSGIADAQSRETNFGNQEGCQAQSQI